MVNRWSLVDAMADYGKYHRNGVNQFIHCLFVPMIFYTLMIMISFIPGLQTPNHLFQTSYSLMSINQYILPVVVLMGLYFIKLHFVLGLITAVQMSLLWVAANYTVFHFGQAALSYAVFGHVFSWAIQFVGHGVFEGTRPALLENVFFWVALLFVNVETAFFLGLYPNLKGRVSKAMDSQYKARFGTKKAL
eukprot:ANDGO_00182.mRNA.1 putative endoplasmic reticulum membrane protein C16E8.02